MALSLQATKREVETRMRQLYRILEDMPATALSRYALSEIVLIRSCSIFEAALAGLAYKIACGGVFENGDADQLLVRCRSLNHARNEMLSKCGALERPRQSLKWTKSRYIAESVDSVIHPDSHYLSRCRAFGREIAEIFEVRNHAAHKNLTSRKGFQKWVSAQYGQERNIQLGYFLLTENLSETPNLKRYLKTITIITTDIVKGP